MISLPTEKHKPICDPHKLITLVYGRPKIGKSTFCSQFPDALFIATEQGLNNLECYSVNVEKYEDLEEIYNLLRTDTKFKTIIIDTVDVFFEIIRRKALDKLGVENEIDLGGQFGQAYKPINDLFKQWVNRFIALNRIGKGVVFTSHSKINMVNKIVPSLPETPCTVLTSAMDLVLYLDTMTDKNGETIRVIHTQPDGQFDAGDRTGKLPKALKLDYNKFMSYFKGEQ